MKFVKIYQENSEPINLEDDDKKDLSSYAKDLSTLLSHQSVTILETSNSVAIVRPSKVTSIVVNEEQNTKEVSDIPAKTKPKEITEDIITDA